MNVPSALPGVTFAAAVMLLAGAYLMGRILVLELLRFRSKRVVVCPATLTPEVVQIRTPLAVLSSFFGEPRLRLKTCSRWPELRNCRQECGRQIEAAPSWRQDSVR